MAARKGTKHHNAKMTPATVRAARRAYESAKEVDGKRIVIDGKRVKVTINSLARKYGLSHQAMGSLLKYETWKDVT